MRRVFVLALCGALAAGGWRMEGDAEVAGTDQSPATLSSLQELLPTARLAESCQDPGDWAGSLGDRMAARVVRWGMQTAELVSTTAHAGQAQAAGPLLRLIDGSPSPRGPASDHLVAQAYCE